MSRILCFGELLLRFAPKVNGRWIRDAQMPVYVGGAELNTATALALWGHEVAYTTALPHHLLGEELEKEISKRNIASRIIWSGGRVGTYYLPQGGDIKSGGVIYDRQDSAFSKLKIGDINWDEIFEDVSWLHISAITPALSESLAELCREALIIAESKNITTSIDLNYREKLWQYGKLPVDVIPTLVQHCNVVMGNIWAAEKMLGISLPINMPTDRDELCKRSADVAASIREAFPKCHTIANTFRFDNNGAIRYYACLHSAEGDFASAEYRSVAIADRVGSGDTFMAGIIHGSIQKSKGQQIIDFAAAAAFNKLFIKGDATTSGPEEIKNMMKTYA